jgi:hypothetical protein
MQRAQGAPKGLNVAGESQVAGHMSRGVRQAGVATSIVLTTDLSSGGQSGRVME